MMTLSSVFWMFVTIFAAIGAFRGWAKEMLVMFSMILALFLLYVLEKYVPGAREMLDIPNGGMGSPEGQVAVRALLIAFLAFFGYQTPNVRTIQSKFARERLQDILLGSVIGALNGYFIFGSLWYYMDQAGYPFTWLASPPTDPQVIEFLSYMPPVLLGEPYIFFAVGAAFVFVIIVFI